jgi:hypothetical protein
MRIPPYFNLRRKSAGHRLPARSRSRSTRPVVESLEGRQLLTTAAISGIQQYGVPSVVAIDGSGNVSYDFLIGTSPTGPVWSGWGAVPGGVNAVAVSTGTVLVDGVSRPYIFMLNSAGDVLYNYQTDTEQWTGWNVVGVNVGATVISSGVIPIVNQPYVVAIDASNNIDISQLNANGTWSGWSTAVVNAGATAISTDFLQVSASPAIYEPYVFELNSSGQVQYAERNTDGSWSASVPVGNDLTATSISALSLGNAPQVFAVGTNGNIYSNTGSVNPVVSSVVSTSAAAVTATSVIRGVRKNGHEPPAATPRHKPLARVVHHPKKEVRTRLRAAPATSPSTNVSWSGWTLVGVGSSATPATATSTQVTVSTNYVFSINSSGQAYSAFGTSGLWSTWAGLGGVASGVAATSISGVGPPGGSSFGFATANSSGGLPIVFAIGSDGNVYWIGQTAWATWGTWTNLGAPT